MLPHEFLQLSLELLGCGRTIHDWWRHEINLRERGDSSMIRAKRDNAQWRKGELGGKGLGVHLVIFGFHAAKVSQIAATINLSVAIQNFAPKARLRQPYSIMMPRDWREVLNSDAEIYGGSN